MSSNTQPSPPPPPPPPPHDEQTEKEAPAELSEIQKELSKILKGVQHDPTLNGIWTLPEDGVLRSLTADRDVVDAVGLRPELIKAFLDRMPHRAENETFYRGADGTKVPREQWFHYDKSKLPPPFIPPEERRNQSPEQLEKNLQMLRERAERPRCPVRIMSDHDLGLKGVTSNPEDGEQC